MYEWRKKLNSIDRQTRERFDVHAPDERCVLKFRLLRFCSNLHTNTDRDISTSLKRKFIQRSIFCEIFFSKIIIVFDVNVLLSYFQKTSTGRPFTGYFYCFFYIATSSVIFDFDEFSPRFHVDRIPRCSRLCTTLLSNDSRRLFSIIVSPLLPVKFNILR